MGYLMADDTIVADEAAAEARAAYAVTMIEKGLRRAYERKNSLEIQRLIPLLRVARVELANFSR